MENKLAGSKIFIRPIEREDLVKRVEWINDPKIQVRLNYPYPVSFGGMNKWYDKVITDFSRRDFSVFTIKEEKYIGFCGLMNIELGVMKAEMYAVLGDKNYWKGGFGTDIFKTTAKFGFEELGLNKVYGYILEHNEASHRVVDNLGWNRDGLLRDDIFSHGKVKNRYIVSMLRKDWILLNK